MNFCSSDDIGMSDLHEIQSDAARKIAASLDSAIHGFIEIIESRPVWLGENAPDGTITPPEIARRAHMVHFRAAEDDEHHSTDWRDFFIWRGDAATSVLAYRVYSGSYVNQNTHDMRMETTIATQPLAPEQWPLPLREFLSIN